MKDQSNLEAFITGERSIRFKFGDKVDKETYKKVIHFCRIVEKKFAHELEELVPSYHTVTVYLKKEPRKINDVVDQILALWQERPGTESLVGGKKITIPVCYDEEFSLDMERVVNHTKLTEKEIITLHTKPTYTVYMIGFLPGFPYLGDLNEKLATPRLETPRLRVEKGTVGIGGQQTGIYPLDSPGGWNIIGKTPIEIYRPDRQPPFLFQAGDQLEFTPISTLDFIKIKSNLENDKDAINDYITK